MRTIGITSSLLRAVLPAALVTLFAVGCGRADSTVNTPAPTAEQTQHVAAPGDLTPVTIYRLPAPATLAGLATETISLSTPTSPKTVIGYGIKAETVRVKETFAFVDPGSSSKTLDVPVDAPDGAVIHLLPKGTDLKVQEATLRDVTVLSPGGMKVSDRSAKKALELKGADAAKPIQMLLLEPALKAGSYSVKVGAAAASNGVAVHVQMPNSKIAMELTPSSTMLYVGDEGHVTIKLLDDVAGIAGATLDGKLIKPDGTPGPEVSFREIGNGVYETKVSEVLGLGDANGVYNVFVHAVGKTSAGVAFDRFGASAFEFVVPNAKIAGLGEVRAVRDAAGKVTRFEVDVDVAAMSKDRYEVSATITAPGPDGTERTVSEGQTAAVTEEGTHTITLSFDAGNLALSKLEGPYRVRKLQLFSQGYGGTLHRIGFGLEAQLPAIKVAEMAPLSFVRPGVDEMIQNGAFDLTK
ncbi:MAG: hypothetical protein NVSMB47_08920 [Polyangiales bacterium]